MDANLPGNFYSRPTSCLQSEGIRLGAAALLSRSLPYGHGRRQCEESPHCKGAGMTKPLVARATAHEDEATQSDLKACADAAVSDMTLKQVCKSLPQLWRRS